VRSTMPLACALPNFPAPSSYPSPLPLNKLPRFLTPLDATLPRPIATAHSKALTENVSPLSATLTKKPGGLLSILLTSSPYLLPFHYPPVLLAPLVSSSFTPFPSSKSFLFIFFADPYLLTRLESHSSAKLGEGGPPHIFLPLPLHGPRNSDSDRFGAFL